MQPTTLEVCWRRRWMPTTLRLAQEGLQFLSIRWRMRDPCSMRFTASLRPSWSDELRSMWRPWGRTAGISSGFQVRRWLPTASRRDLHSSEMRSEGGWTTPRSRCSSPKMPVLVALMTSGVSRINSQQKIWPVRNLKLVTRLDMLILACTGFTCAALPLKGGTLARWPADAGMSHGW